MITAMVKNSSWTSKPRYIIYVLKENKGKVSELYQYSEFSTSLEDYIKKETFQKPVSLCFLTTSTEKGLLDFLKKMYHSYDCNIEILNKTPDELNLIVPDINFDEEISFEQEVSPYITEDIFSKIKKIDFEEPIVVVGQNVSNIENKVFKPDYFKNNNYSVNENFSFTYYCTKCKKKFTKDASSYAHSFYCPHCKNTVYNRDLIILKELKDKLKNNFNSRYSYYAMSSVSLSKKSRFVIMGSTENGIYIYRIMREIVAEKGKVKERFVLEYSIEHNIGGICCSQKHLKKSVKKCDAFEALNINSKNITIPPQIIYADAEDFTDFATQNEKFLKMSGFQSVLKYSSRTLNLEAFFFVYIGLLQKYPILEQLIKMGHANLFFSLYDAMISSTNKEGIQNIVNNLNEIVDREATKGKEGLRFPAYIGDYLIKKNASIDEYFYWRDMYEISKLTKEQFENFIDSFNFAWINSQVGLADIGNILKYGYSAEKLFSYIMKQHRTKKFDIYSIIKDLTDYLNMCDIAEVEPDKFPQDVRKQHDDMCVFFERREKKIYDKLLRNIGEECEKYVIPKEDELNRIGIPKLFNTLTVVFPKSESDFIEEGNQQHNCVGSYPRIVREGNSVVFFIRNKDNINKSFITAECTSHGLGQCFYSNNRPVYDDDLKKFASYICKKILAGCSSKKIKALTNLK